MSRSQLRVTLLTGECLVTLYTPGTLMSFQIQSFSRLSAFDTPSSSFLSSLHLYHRQNINMLQILPPMSLIRRMRPLSKRVLTLFSKRDQSHRTSHSHSHNSHNARINLTSPEQYYFAIHVVGRLSRCAACSPNLPCSSPSYPRYP